ncbi:cell envelope biogenesis protein TolA [Bradyrhizobium sp. 2TAF36]|jgi:hypothetical protein|uniref:cell envelope biogenesis protein TolA n=1 Tax=Bradyrhizobium sp. 2TAF36 TaxID=3233016 RepID=UPI003F917201
MPRKLKTYQTSLGFYDLAIAAPSMKFALEAWGAGSNLFHQGHAKETDEPDVVAATMAKPGVVLKRPAGSSGPFAEHADLPDLEEGAKPKKSRRPEPKRRAAPKTSVEDSRKAAAQFEREQQRRDAERRREEAVREKERAKREKAIAKTQAALDAAQREHDERSENLEAERRDVEKRIEAEEARWEGEREKLRDALHRARE